MARRLNELALIESVAAVIEAIESQPSPSAQMLLYAATALEHFGAMQATRTPVRELPHDPTTYPPFFGSAARSAVAHASFYALVVTTGDSMDFATVPGDVVGGLPSWVFETYPTLVELIHSRMIGSITAVHLVALVAGSMTARHGHDLRGVTSLLDPRFGCSFEELLMLVWAPLLRAIGFDALDDRVGLAVLLSELSAYRVVDYTISHGEEIKYVLMMLGAAEARFLLLKDDAAAATLVPLYTPPGRLAMLAPYIWPRAGVRPCWRKTNAS
jgi:hypothetical protein